MDLTTAIAVSAGTIGIVLSVVFYRRSQRDRKPCWAVRNTNLIKGYSASLDRLQVLYARESVQSVSAAWVMIWNVGRETIDQADIAPTDVLRIQARDGVRILDSKALDSSRDANQFAVADPDSAGSSVNVKFDYLGPGEGGIAQIIHTGTAATDLSVVGSVKGVDKLEQRRVDPMRFLPLPTPRSWDLRRSHAAKRRIYAALVSLLITGLLASTVGAIVVEWRKDAQISWTTLALGILYALFLAIVGWRRIRRSALPKGLDIYADEMF